MLYTSMQKLKQLKHLDSVDAKALFTGEIPADTKVVDINEIRSINIIDEQTGRTIRIEQEAA